MANSNSNPLLDAPLSAPELPCDGDGTCMLCKKKPLEVEKLVCKTCATPWHVECLVSPPESMGSVASWDCPDCVPSEKEAVKSIVSAVVSGAAGELLAKIREIEADDTLSEPEKAKKRQQLLGGVGSAEAADDGKMVGGGNELMNILGENIKCSFCMQLPDRPVTTSCGHNFCLKCFEKWWGQGKRTCAKCREKLPAVPPRINSSLVFAMRMARVAKPAVAVVPRLFKRVRNDDLPDEAFTTERAKKAGKANAKSGRIFVSIPNDYMGPITPEYDPSRNMGVLVGDSWTDRMACRQWGAHFPHVSGIAGQSKFGAQSVVLSGGYLDDEDHGEWFLYTGSGGRDLSGNKRTSQYQTHDQKFSHGNESLRLSCRKGYPVRVVRSFKEVRSNYAPETGVRYDGIYRIEKCWQTYATEKVDKQLVKSPYLVCRYLFVRCDNTPAPWTSDDHGDQPRPLPIVPELKVAKNLTERKESPHWDFDEDEGCWKWKMPAPPSKLSKKGRTGRTKKRSKANILKEFKCLICRKVLTLPVTTPCAHNFCKSCLDAKFEGQKFERERKAGGRSLRTQKTVMKCPSCTTDISEFLQNAQVNRELMGVIDSLMQKFNQENADSEENSGARNESESLSEDADISTSDIEDSEALSMEEETEMAMEEETEMAMEEPHGENGNLDEVKIEPLAAKKRGRPKKSNAANGAAAKTDADISTSDITENEVKSVEEKTEIAVKEPHVENGNLDGESACENPDEVKIEPPAAKKRGRPKKTNAANGGAAKTRGRKSRRVAEDGNDSPSSPLHVCSDNELE